MSSMSGEPRVVRCLAAWHVPGKLHARRVCLEKLPVLARERLLVC